MSSPYRKLKRVERVERKRDFTSAYERGRRTGGRLFISFVLQKQEGPLRLGVVASKKVGGAVKRNRAKRLLREIFRTNRPTKDVAADVVLIARSAITNVRYREIEKAYVNNVLRVLEEKGTGPG